MQIISNVEQGSADWLALRLGIVTCSEIADLMVDGKGEAGFGVAAFTYMDRLIGERITGAEANPWKGNANSERGHALEPIVGDLYCARRDLDPGSVEQVAIILNHGIGYSPDGLVGENGLIEVKTHIPEKLIKSIIENEVPKDHVDQCQGGLWASEREWIDYIGYWPGMPMCLVRAYRDEARIRKMSERVKTFYEIMEARMERVLAA